MVYNNTWYHAQRGGEFDESTIREQQVLRRDPEDSE